MFLDLLKTVPQYLLPQPGLNTFSRWVADIQNPRIKNYIIRRFINKYGVNMQEALLEDPEAYTCFNEFFIRHLKPDCRSLDKADILSPVDGCISEIGVIKEGQLLQAKGRYYAVEEFLACDQALAQQFVQGQFATFYLSPKDYHRVHMPMEAKLKSMTYIPGALFSVQPTTARVIPNLFARNERIVVLFETRVGLMAMVLVGAAIVGAIGTRWQGVLKRARKIIRFDYSGEAMSTLLAQGEEMGFFKLGSTVVLLFADGKQVEWGSELGAGIEVRFGQAIGRFPLEIAS